MRNSILQTMLTRSWPGHREIGGNIHPITAAGRGSSVSLRIAPRRFNLEQPASTSNDLAGSRSAQQFAQKSADPPGTRRARGYPASVLQAALRKIRCKQPQHNNVTRPSGLGVSSLRLKIPYQHRFAGSIRHLKRCLAAAGKHSRIKCCGAATPTLMYSVGRNNFRRDYATNWLAGWDGGNDSFKRIALARLS